MNRLTKLAGIALLAGAATIGCGKATETEGQYIMPLAHMDLSEQYAEDEKLNVQLGKAKAVQIMDLMSGLENQSNDEGWRKTEQVFSYAWSTVGYPKEKGGCEGGLWSNDVKVTYNDFGEVGPSRGDRLQFEQDVFLGTWGYSPEGEYSREQGRLYMKNQISISIGPEDLHYGVNHYSTDFQNNDLLTKTLESLKKGE